MCQLPQEGAEAKNYSLFSKIEFIDSQRRLEGKPPYIV